MGSLRKSQLSKAKQDHLIEHFVAGAIARYAEDLVRVNPKTAIYYFHRLSKIISYHFEQEADTFFSEEIEVGESYFGGKRKEKRGRGAVGKVRMFGILRRRGKVYTNRCFISNIIPHY
jgi:transposase